MAPQHSTRYIGELVRVLESVEGCSSSSCRVRDRRTRHRGPRRVRQRRPLPDDAFAAATHVADPPSSLLPGQSISLEVVVENRSPHLWPSLPDTLGKYQINVGNRWLHEDGELVQRDDGRCPLDYDLRRERARRAMLIVTAPAADGVYLLEIDLVQEDVGWFGERGRRNASPAGRCR